MFHIVKDKDGNERVMNDKEYAEYKSLNAAGDFVQAVAVGAFQSGGLVLALNLLLPLGIMLFYMMACLSQKAIPQDWTVMEEVGVGASLVLIPLGLIRVNRWLALLFNVTIFGALFYLVFTTR